MTIWIWPVTTSFTNRPLNHGWVRRFGGNEAYLYGTSLLKWGDNASTMPFLSGVNLYIFSFKGVIVIALFCCHVFPSAEFSSHYIYIQTFRAFTFFLAWVCPYSCFARYIILSVIFLVMFSPFWHPCTLPPRLPCCSLPTVHLPVPHLSNLP